MICQFLYTAGALYAQAYYGLLGVPSTKDKRTDAGMAIYCALVLCWMPVIPIVLWSCVTGFCEYGWQFPGLRYHIGGKKDQQWDT